MVLHGEAAQIEQEQIPEYFTPVNGKWRMKGMLFRPYKSLETLILMLAIADLFKTFADCESYNSGHGHTYDTYSIDKSEGAVVVVRPDHCMISILKLDEGYSF